MNKFRDLKVDEVELRINRINEYGCSLLLYKDARCDMSILDETVGPMNWKREHTRNNANCIVSIWDEEKKTVDKQGRYRKRKLRRKGEGSSVRFF